MQRTRLRYWPPGWRSDQVMATKRVTVLWAVLGLVGGMALGAWYAGSRIQSPAEMAARTAPPEAVADPGSGGVARAEFRCRHARHGPLRAAAADFDRAVHGQGRHRTDRHAAAAKCRDFRKARSFCQSPGRPVFVLRGATPAYRDMSPGISGGDVRQLEEALDRLGFDPGTVDGIYDQKTSAAVERWYRKAGWDPFGPTREQRAAILALERDWSDAVRSRLAAEAARETAVRAVAAARALAEQNTRQAALDSAARAGDRRRVPDTRVGQSLALETERARAAHSATAAAADVAAQIADRAIDRARSAPDRNSPCRGRGEAESGARRAAQGEAGGRSGDSDRDARGRPGRRADPGRRGGRECGSPGRRAQRARRAGTANARRIRPQGRERTSRSGWNASSRRRASRLGVQVPADEVVFIPSLPVRVHEVTAAVGANASGPVMSVTDNQLSIDSQLPIGAAPLVKPGMKVAIDEQALGIKATGVVETVANTPGTRGVDGYHFYLGVKVESTPVSLAGFSVRLTIPIETSKGAVTAVPTSAVSLAVDGTSRVQVDRGGALEYVTVQPGLSAGGYVEVTAPDGRLVPGQLVVVGYKTPEPEGVRDEVGRAHRAGFAD